LSNNFSILKYLIACFSHILFQNLFQDIKQTTQNPLSLKFQIYESLTFLERTPLQTPFWILLNLILFLWNIQILFSWNIVSVFFIHLYLVTYGPPIYVMGNKLSLLSVFYETNILQTGYITVNFPCRQIHEQTLCEKKMHAFIRTEINYV